MIPKMAPYRMAASPQMAPIAAEHQIMAAVFNPRTLPQFLKMTPAPRKPTPETTYETIWAWPRELSRTRKDTLQKQMRELQPRRLCMCQPCAGAAGAPDPRGFREAILNSEVLQNRESASDVISSGYSE